MNTDKGGNKTRVRHPLDSFENKLSGVLEGLMTLLFVSIFLLVVILVLLRYVFNTSLTGANEAITILFIYTTAIGSALAIGSRQHIGITFLADIISPAIYKVLDGLGLLLIVVLNLVMAWYSLEWLEATGQFLMPSTGLPRWVVQLSIPAGCCLAVIYCILKFARALLGVEPLGKKWMRED